MTEGIHARITVDNNQFESGIKQSEKSSKQFEDALDQVAKSSKKTDAALDNTGDAADKLSGDFSGATAQSKRLKDSLSKLKGQANKADQSVMAMAGSLRVMGAAAAAAGAALTTAKLVSVTREFDVINASLVTVTGSTEKAAEAFSLISDFAQKTPFALSEVADSFVKLKALGLDPSAAAIESYGNTASAMGKSLNQMIEAVADASTGEFERLKEFGIKANSEGDRVKFTFQGITREIGKNSAEIQQYLLDIGNTQFAGAMEQRVATLDGAISNLGDSWDQLFLTISQSGVGDAIEDSVRLATRVIQQLNEDIRRLGGNLTVLEEFAKGAQRIAEINKKIADIETGPLLDFLKKGKLEDLRAEKKLLQDKLKLLREENELTVMGGKAPTKLPPVIVTAPKGAVGTTSATSSASQSTLSALIRTLGTEEDRVRQSYSKRNTDIINSTAKGSEQRAELLKANETKLQEDLLKIQRNADLKRLEDFSPASMEQEALQRVTMFSEITGVDSSEGLEKENELHRLRMEQIATQREEEMIGTQEFNRLLEEEEARHMDALNGIRHSGLQGLNKLIHDSYGDQAADVASGLKSMLQSMSSHSKAAFKLNKGLSLADAIVKGYDAATAAWAYGMKVGGPPAAAAFAGASVAKTGAQIAAIKGTQFGGSGSVSGGGATSTATTTPTVADTQENRIVSINLSGGDLYSGAQVRDLIGAINEELDAGLDLRINP